MAGTITTGNIPRLLETGLNKIFGATYDEHPKEFDKIFDTFDSRKNFETDAQLEGLGLAPEKPEGDEINFDSFRQGDGSGTREHGGMGVGLSLARQLAEKMNGRLEVTTEFGRGSVFSLRLPAA